MGRPWQLLLCMKGCGRKEVYDEVELLQQLYHSVIADEPVLKFWPSLILDTRFVAVIRNEALEGS